MNDFWWWQSAGNLKARLIDLLAEAEALVDASTAASDPREVLQRLDDLARLLDHPRAASSLLAQNHSSESIRRSALEAHGELVTFLTDRLSDPALFIKLSDALDELSGDEAVKAGEWLLGSLKVNGADRALEDRVHLREMRIIMSRTAALYRRHLSLEGPVVSIDHPEELAGLDAPWRQQHLTQRQGTQGVRVTAGVAGAVLTRCDVTSTRRRVWEALNAHGWPDNGPVLRQLLEARQEAACALGFPDWATLEVSHTALGDVGKVRGFLRRVEGAARGVADRERERLTSDAGLDSLPPWSRAWARERSSVKAPASSAATPSLVIQTLRGLLERTLRWRIRAVDGVSIWAREIVVWEVSDAEGLLGRVFLDLGVRAGKGASPKTMRIRTGDAGDAVAEVALIGSLPSGKAMPHSAVLALFHEAGHVVHHLCASRSAWAVLNGLPAGRDVVEIAPHVFEAWAWEPEVLSALGWTLEGGQRLRDRDIATRGARAMRQLLYSDYSLSIHEDGWQSGGLDTLDERLFERYGDGAECAERLYAHFPHLLAYGATYFAYPWSRAVARDVLGQISGPTCAPGALRPFVEQVLCPGQTQDITTGLREFLGRPWHVQAYLDWLAGSPDEEGRG